METFKLSKPIDINGQQVAELPYDFDAMTAKDKLEAGKRMKYAGVQMGAVDTFDSDYHLYLFAAAVVRANPEIDYPDVFRMGARDAIHAGALAQRFFFLNTAE